MKDILEKLEERRAARTRRRRPDAHRRAAQARQADRTRAARAVDGQGLVRGVRHVRRAPLGRLRHGEQQDSRRRRRHRLGHGQRPHGVRLRQGLHRVRRLAVRGARAEDRQDPGHGDEGARAHHRPVRRRRRPHPGRRGGARRLRRGVQAQRHRVGRDPADFRHHGAVRGRRCLFARDDRFRLHGARHQLHVRHRSRRGEDRDQRGGDGGGARRRFRSHHQIGHRGWLVRQRRRMPAADPPPARLSPHQQPGRRARVALVRRRRARGEIARYAHPRQSEQALRHQGAHSQDRGRGRLLRAAGRVRAQHRHRLRAHRRPQRRLRRQPADGARGRARHRRVAQGRALRALLRRVRDSHRHLRVMGMLCSPRTLSHGGKSPHRSLPSNTETCYGFCAGPEGRGP